MKKRNLKTFCILHSAFCISGGGRRSAAGFTLVELMVVIVIMAIIIAISVPAFIGLGRGAGMRGAVSSVHSTLALTRQWAITHREPVTFNAEKNDPSASYYFATALGVTIVSNDLPLDVIFAADYPDIIFKTDGGLASGFPTVSIDIRDRKFPADATKGKTISINALTGGIRVE